MADISFNDLTYDLILSSGDLVFTSDTGFPETMRQRIRAALQLFLGEWFLDDADNPSVGVPYFQSLFTDKIPTLELADAVFRTALLNVEGVAAVEEIGFEYEPQTRKLDVDFRVVLTDGSTIEDIIDFGV